MLTVNPMTFFQQFLRNDNRPLRVDLHLKKKQYLGEKQFLHRNLIAHYCTFQAPLVAFISIIFTISLI